MQKSFSGNTSPRLPETMLLIRKGWLWVGVQFIFLGIFGLVLGDTVPEDSWWVHGLWCIAGMALALHKIARAFQSGIMIFLIDHRVVFTVAFAAYFLLGASMLAFGPEEEIADRLVEYPVNAGIALRIDGVNSIGFGIALSVSAFAHWKWLAKQIGKVALAVHSISPFATVVVLMTVGVLVSFRVFLYDFALLQEEAVLSGIWRAVANFSLVGIFLGISYRGLNEYGIKLFAVLMVLT